MTPAPDGAACRDPSQTGLTIIEAVIILVIIAMVVGALTPGVVRQLQHARVNRAARVVAADLFLSQSLAGRQHVPITVVIDATMLTATLRHSRTDSVLVVRRFGADSDFGLQTLTENRKIQTSGW